MNDTEQVGCDESVISGATMETYLKHFEYFLLGSCFFSTFLQFYVIAKAITHIKRATGDECLHIFLLSMTVGDLLLTCFCYPIEQLREQHVITPPAWVNVSQHFLTWVGLSASSLSLILLNADKLLYFKFPLRYSMIVTKTKGYLIVVAVWLGCAIFVAVCWYLECFQCEEGCARVSILPKKVVMYAVFMVSACVAPSLTSLFVAFYILNVVSSHRSKLDNTSSSSYALAARLRTFYFIFMTTVFTVATLLPFRIYNIKKTMFPPSPHDIPNCLTTMFSWTCFYLVSLNAILNPLITVTVLPQYRFQWLYRIFGCAASQAVHV